MLLRNAIRLSFSKVKSIKISGVAEGNGTHFNSQTESKDFKIDNPL